MKFILLLLLLAGCTVTGSVVKDEPLEYNVYLCPDQNCYKEFSKILLNASSASCALYNVDPAIMANATKRNISIKVITDRKAKIKSVRKSRNNALMHNKFCIIDNSSVITGSFNPVSGSTADYNNMIFLRSPSIVENYQEEFDELWFSRQNKATRNTRISVVENYFCPEDHCADQVEQEIKAAKKSIYFMSYSFTHKGIANGLIVKKAEGIEVRGIIEKGNLEGSVYETLRKNKVDVKPDNSKKLLHHKVFIIDNATVITGSFNPTKSANERNDENIIILHDKEVAKEFAAEFFRLYG